MWKEEIIEMLSNRTSRNWEEAPWKLLNKLLEGKLIPEKEIDDFMRNIVREVKVPHRISLDVLKENGYMRQLKDYLYANSPYSFQFVNDKWEKIKLYLESENLDKKIVEKIDNKYRWSEYGDFKRGMDMMMMMDVEFKDKYTKTLL